MLRSVILFFNQGVGAQSTVDEVDIQNKKYLKVADTSGFKKFYDLHIKTTTGTTNKLWLEDGTGIVLDEPMQVGGTRVYQPSTRKSSILINANGDALDANSLEFSISNARGFKVDPINAVTGLLETGWKVSDNVLHIGLDNGRVRVYEYDETTYGWELRGGDIVEQTNVRDIEGKWDGEGNDDFGTSVSLSQDGNYVAIGAPNSNKLDMMIILL